MIAGLAAGRVSALVADRYRPRRAAFRISRRRGRRPVPVTELVTAAAWLAVVHRFGLGWAALPPLVAATSLVTLSVIDLRVYRLPDAVTLPALAASLAAVVAASAALGRPSAVVAASLVAAGYGAVMWAAHEIQPSGLGFGDVKLAPLLGLHIGWVAGALHSGWRPVVSLALQALLMSCLIGVATGLALAMLRRRGHRILDDPAPAGGDPMHTAPADDPAPAGRPRPEAHPFPSRRPPKPANDPVLSAHGGDPATAASPRLRDTSFPFGPALAAGTMIAVLFSEALVA